MKPRSLKELLQQQEGITIPPVELEFSFGSHHTKDDAKRIRPHVQDADFLLVEMVKWSLELPALLTGVARSTVSHKKLASAIGAGSDAEPFVEGLLRGMKKGGLYVHPFDLPAGHPAIQEAAPFLAIGDNPSAFIDLAPQPGPTPPFEEAVAVFEQIFVKIANFNVARENYAISSLPSIVAGIVRENPKLLQKEKLSGKIIFGRVHHAMESRLRRAYTDIHVTSAVDNPEYAFSYRSMYMQRLLSAEQPGETKERAFCEYIAQIALGDTIKAVGLERSERFTRIVTDSLSPNVWRTYYAALFQDKIAAKQFLIDELSKVGVPVALDEKGADDFFRTYEHAK